MNSILKELYRGNINPQAKPVEPGSPYGRALWKLSTLEENLLSLLQEEEKKMLLQYINTWGDFNTLAQSAAFIEGFRLGSQITYDAFLNTQSDLT